MSENSKIEWTHHTFNPWWGCTKVSEGCKNCYALRDSKRYGYDIWGPTAERRFFGEKHWAEPLAWNRKAAREGERRRVFCASMADVFEFHDNMRNGSRMDFERQRLWALIDATPMLDWLILTKRPEHMRGMLPPAWRVAPRPNVWLGTSAEDQANANERIPHLLRTPAAVRFVSAEPLLGPIDFADYVFGMPNPDPAPVDGNYRFTDGPRLDWVIVGGESGPGARRMHPAWARGIRDQCVAAGVAFHFKQWGEFAPPHITRVGTGHPDDELHEMHRVGKKVAGRSLDGRTWDELPKAGALVSTSRKGERS